MKVGQQIFENTIKRLCDQSDVGLIINYLNTIESQYKTPGDTLLDKIAISGFSSGEKLEILNKLYCFYNGISSKYFSRVIAKSLISNKDVTAPLLSRYGDLYTKINNKEMLIYLWDIKRYDLIDGLIVGMESKIRNYLFDLKYYTKCNKELISYVTNQLGTKSITNRELTFTKIYLYSSLTEEYYLYSDEITSIKINGVSVEQFINQNCHFIEKMEIISDKGFVNIIPYSYPDFEELDPEAYSQADNICRLELSFLGSEPISYSLNNYSFDEDFDFLQRYEKVDNKYVWTYSNNKITSNFFLLPVFEEYIKHIKKLPYNHKILQADLDDINNICLVCDENGLLSNLQIAIEDIKKLPNLSKLLVSFVDNESLSYDVSPLKELTDLNWILFRNQRQVVWLKNLEQLARPGITIILESFYKYDYFCFDKTEFQRLQKHFEDAGGVLRLEHDSDVSDDW